jgi:Ca2+-binding EF-hand superfamily protein
MNIQVIAEEWKEGARERLSRRYKPEEAENMLKGREDYIRFKLNEAFRYADTNQDGAISVDELYQFLIQKGAEKKKDPNYDLTALQKERIRQFFEDVDVEGSGRVDM